MSFELPPTPKRTPVRFPGLISPIPLSRILTKRKRGRSPFSPGIPPTPSPIHYTAFTPKKKQKHEMYTHLKNRITSALNSNRRVSSIINEIDKTSKRDLEKPGIEALHLAVQNVADPRVLRKLIVSKKVNVNKQDFETERTPLHISVDEGDFLTTEILLNHGAKTNTKDLFGLTPLHYAAYTMDPRLITLVALKGTTNATKIPTGDNEIPLYMFLEGVYETKGKRKLNYREFEKVVKALVPTERNPITVLSKLEEKSSNGPSSVDLAIAIDELRLFRQPVFETLLHEIMISKTAVDAVLSTYPPEKRKNLAKRVKEQLHHKHHKRNRYKRVGGFL